MLTSFSEFSVPHGYRFNPTKEEIFYFYLIPAIIGDPLPSNALIEHEIYGENKEPWKIFDKHARNSIWIFTKLKKKSKSRIDRTAGSGCWLARSMKEVKDEHGELLGFHKYFTYKKDQSNQDNGHWIMHEFSLGYEGLNEYVICEIKNKDVVDSDYQDKVEPKIKKRKTLTDEEMKLISVVKKVRADKNPIKGNSDEWNQQNSRQLDDKKSHYLSKLQRLMSTRNLKLRKPDSTDDSPCPELGKFIDELEAPTGNELNVDTLLSKLDSTSVELLCYPNSD